MPLNKLGHWQPEVSPKQLELMHKCHPDNPEKKKFLCLSGPRRSSKTMGALNVMVQHAWETPNAQIVMIAPTMSAAADGGPWQTLTEYTIPDWIAGGWGLKWVKEPYTEGASKRQKCKITNKHGGVSTIMLESLREGEKDISKRFKGRMFSMIYWSEVGSWVQERLSFDLLIECLRIPGLSAQRHHLIIDTNPSDAGTQHWIYKLFYEFRSSDDIPDKQKALQRSLELVEFFIADNPYLSEEDVELLHAQYDHDADLKARYLEGRWVAASTDALFYENFRPNVHVIPPPNEASPTDTDPEILLPEKNCFQLTTGWDPGQSNHAVCFIEPVTQKRVVQVAGVSEEREITIFKVFDEIVHIKSDIVIAELAEEAMEKMNFWESLLLEDGGDDKVMWEHFSDRSAFDYRDSISDRYQHQEVSLASRGRINLIAVEKGDGTVRQRIDILRKLLFQDRIFFSRERCPITIESIKALKKGKGTQAVNRQSRHKHAFDALTYALSSLCFEELTRQIRSQLRSDRRETGLVTVPL